MLALAGTERDEAIRTLVRQALRYHYASLQDRDLLVAARHNAYAVALLDGARQFSTDDEIHAATGKNARDLWREISAAQDRIEGQAFKVIGEAKAKGVAIPESLGTLPSEEAVRRMVRGEPGGIGEVVGLTLARSVMIMFPFLLLRVETWKAMGGAVLASALITTFVTIKVRQDEKA